MLASIPRTHNATQPAVRRNLRQELHDAIDRICDSEPNINAEANSHGYGPGRNSPTVTGGDISDPTYTRMLAPQNARQWLTDKDHLVNEIRTIRDRAIRLDPRPSEKTVAGVTRKICASCGQPVMNKWRRVDGRIYHNGPCREAARYAQTRNTDPAA